MPISRYNSVQYNEGRYNEHSAAAVAAVADRPPAGRGETGSRVQRVVRPDHILVMRPHGGFARALRGLTRDLGR